MKNSSLLRVTAAIALLPSFVMGSIEITWSVANVPQNGLTDITFPISIANAPNRTGYYCTISTDRSHHASQGLMN
jgi:hypothetical protein